jgi:hypothetical protein
MGKELSEQAVDVSDPSSIKLSTRALNGLEVLLRKSQGLSPDSSRAQVVRLVSSPQDLRKSLLVMAQDLEISPLRMLLRIPGCGQPHGAGNM